MQCERRYHTACAGSLCSRFSGNSQFKLKLRHLLQAIGSASWHGIVVTGNGAVHAVAAIGRDCTPRASCIRSYRLAFGQGPRPHTIVRPMLDYAIHRWQTILTVVCIFVAPGLFGRFMAGPSDGSGVWMQDRPNLCWALVWFGLAVFSRFAWLIDPVPSERIESWTGAGMCSAFSLWFLIQHWLDKREERWEAYKRRRDEYAALIGRWGEGSRRMEG